jgi:hypothetical protein
VKTVVPNASDRKARLKLNEQLSVIELSVKQYETSLASVISSANGHFSSRAKAADVIESFSEALPLGWMSSSAPECDPSLTGCLLGAPSAYEALSSDPNDLRLQHFALYNMGLLLKHNNVRSLEHMEPRRTDEFSRPAEEFERPKAASKPAASVDQQQMASQQQVEQMAAAQQQMQQMQQQMMQLQNQFQTARAVPTALVAPQHFQQLSGEQACSPAARQGAARIPWSGGASRLPPMGGAYEQPMGEMGQGATYLKPTYY